MAIRSQAAARTYRLVFLAGLLLMLAANLPGHLSVDSVMALYEGRFHVRETFGPAVYSRTLGLFDEVLPGAALYVTCSACVLFGALASLVDLRERASWWGVALASVLTLSPTLLLYQGIVWKDVLFANLSVAAFVLLAHAELAEKNPTRRWTILLAASLALAVAMSVRQNGVILVIAAAAVVGWRQGDRGWGVGLAWSAGAVTWIVALAQTMSVLAQPIEAGQDKAFSGGLRIVQHYDVVGILAHAPEARLSVIARTRPEAARLIETEGRKVYSPERIDTFDLSSELSRTLWKTPERELRAQWWTLVSGYPGAYLAHRWDALVWVLINPRLEQCVPIHVGVEGPASRLQALGVTPGQDRADVAIANYATWWYVTPFYSHLAFAAAALIVAGFLIFRREACDLVIAALMLGGLAFAGSFFLISLACDYRYLYALDLAAITGLLYLALDPPVIRGERRP